MSKFLDFLQEVKYEAIKVTWPSKKETTTSVVMVVLMVIFFSVFFLLTDSIIVKIIDLVTNL